MSTQHSALAACAAVALLLGCSKKSAEVISIDGSSTVFPITEAVAEEFQKENAGARVTVGISGTGGGFKKFCTGETDISDASRPIKPSEVELCKKHGVEYVELPIAFDGITIIANPKNDWAKHITVKELKKIFEPEAQGKVTKWSEVREGWPDKPLRLFGAGVDSGTYDYFTEAVVGKEHSSRGDFTSSEDDNVIVQGVAADPYTLGFLGFAYYENSKSKLRAIPVDDEKADNGDAPTEPTMETIRTGTYQPLSRPVFIYVSTKSLDKPIVAKFVDFYMTRGEELVKDVHYIPLPSRGYELAKARAHKRVTGSLFGGKGSQIGVSIEKLLEGS
ncbi:MAG: PstS family phosphate ABC transporter substrate-binding protein [Polyangiaceae bacterium]|nr:PstS family phosphate ABC transporter substrate-binding protein [Polyangiaceae bacterium]